MKKGKFNVIIGGQAGSESKGKLSAWICDHYQVDALFMASSPNAGHTVVTNTGEKKVTYHLPAGALVCNAPIYLGPTSLINIVKFRDEIRSTGIDPKRINIDPRVSIITPDCITGEVCGKFSDIGSTLQGVGMARINKIKRDNSALLVDSMDLSKCPVLSQIHVVDVTSQINWMLAGNETVLCEMTQGFDLCLEHGIHPQYCTSKMISPQMALAEAGVPVKYLGDVHGVIRPYPIRVNNRTGTSGPYAEAKEISWDIVASECEYPGLDKLMEITTTTKLPRRVFRFSWKRYEEFLMVCDPTSICLQFVNYIKWIDYKKTEWRDISGATRSFIESLEKKGCPVEFVGTGPAHHHMIHRHVGYKV